jgi:hypothetical protein
MALTPFEQEFKSQRELLGPGKTFTFKGKEYTTDYAKPKTESNRGGARMKSGKDVMDTLPKVGKVETRELAPKKSPADKVQYDPTSSSYYADVGNSKLVKVSVPKDKGQTKGFKAEDMGMNQYKKPELDDFIPTKKAIPGSFDKPMSDLPGRFPTKKQTAIEPADKSDTRTIPQKISEFFYPEGGYKLDDMKFKGEKPVSKAKGGLVTAKRSSKRGCGIAVKGFGRAGGR